ncbi:unnamed protein product, partial [Amoebophrya sp. A25]
SILLRGLLARRKGADRDVVAGLGDRRDCDTSILETGFSSTSVVKFFASSRTTANNVKAG